MAAAAPCIVSEFKGGSKIPAMSFSFYPKKRKKERNLYQKSHRLPISFSNCATFYYKGAFSWESEKDVEINYGVNQTALLSTGVYSGPVPEHTFPFSRLM